MTAPNHPTSRIRSLSIKKLRLSLLVGLVVIAATVLSSINSDASSLGRRLFASATAIINGTALEAKASRMNDSPEFAATAQTQSSTMSVGRRGHTSTRLSDGRVLIAGGEDANGALNQSEIYDPAAATFSAAINLTAARVDHTATLLADGRVLIAGGRNATGWLNTTEIFDPVTDTFIWGPTMGVARGGHSATLLGNGRVLVAGGDANGSSETFDPSAGSFNPGGSLTSARSLHAAARLLDGRVLLVGGSDASGNPLDTAEIFDPSDGSSSAVNGLLTVARVLPHLHVLFDGKVQIIGGNHDRSMEIYDPAINTIGAYAHVLPDTDPCPNLVNHILASQTRAALFHNGQSDPVRDRSGHTITELAGPSRALILGGEDSSGSVLGSHSILNSSPASISTDKLDYKPGETVSITGRGWQPGETVRLMIHEDPHTAQERGLDVVADAQGSFVGSYLVQDYDLEMRFIAGARGLTSGWTAQTTFTDGTSNLDVAPAWYPTNPGSVKFSALVRITAPPNNNRQCVRLVVPAGYTGVALDSFSVGVAGWTSVVNGNVIRLSGATALVPGNANAWARFDVTATPPVAATSAAWVAQIGNATSAVSDCSGGLNSDNAVIRIGAALPRVFKADFRDAGGVVIAPETGTVGVSKEYRLRISNTSGGGGDDALYATIALPPCFSAPLGVVVTTSNGTDPDFVAVLTDNFIRLTGGKLKKDINPDDFVEVRFTTTPQSGCSSVFRTTLWKDIEHHPNDIAHIFSHQGDHPSVNVSAAATGTTTAVTSSQNPSTFGQAITFTATVTPASGSTAPTGTVQFKIDGVDFGSPATLSPSGSNGVANSNAIATLNVADSPHDITAVYSPTGSFTGSTSPVFQQTVNKRDTLTTVSSSLNPSTFGESVTFTATVVGTGAGAGNPSGGSVQFKIDGSNVGGPVALVAGSASSGAISTLTAGNHTVEAFFTSADTNFNDSNDALDGGQTVNKRDTLTTVSSSLNPSTFGENVTFTATVVGTGAGAGNPSAGSVQFKIDGANFGGPVALVAGAASVNTSSLNAGNHTVEAFFTSADTNFNDSNDALDGGQTVNKRDTLTTVSSSLNPSTFGENVTFTATVVGTGAGAGNPSGGSVQFKIDGANFGGPVALVAGSASVNTSSLNAGNHTVEAFFTSADTNFNDSNDALDGGQTVNKRDTLTTVSSSLNPSTFGENITFTATVVGTGAGAGNPSGGSVQFKIDGANFGGPVALVAGSASVNTGSLNAGNHTVEAFFTSADTNFNDSNDALDGGQTVNKRDTLTTVSSSLNPSTFGENVTFTATVVGTGAGAGNPSGGSVQFKIDGANFGGPVALVAGSASVNTGSLSAGNHTVEAFFTSADTNFNDSNDALDGGQTVNKRDTLTTVSSSLNPSTFGENVTFTATVVGTGAGAGNPSGGSVQFKIDGANFGGPVALVAGSASVNTSSLNAGNHTVEAFFTSADPNFNDSNDALDGGQTVNKRDTLTTVSSSLNPSTFGESVTFTATVVGTGPGAGNPSGGSVQFKIDGSNFGGPVALVGGSASSGAISTLTAGNHTVEAFFTSADTNFNDSNDALDGGQTVNKRDTFTTVSSSLNPSTFGENVTFTATVVGTGAGAGDPSGGFVQFKIDGSNFGAPVALVAGSASVNTSTLTAGNHTVEAFFTSADTNFNDSNDSLDGGQTVNKRDTLTTVSSSLNPSTFGESVTFTATVVGTGAGAGDPTGGSVQFKIDGSDFGGPVALVAGSASSGAISTLTAGNHTVEAFFTSADTNFNDSNDALDGGQTVNKRDTLTTVSSSLNPSTFGESVTFTATVAGTGAGAGNPSGGSVQFKIDGTNFGGPVALTSGSASSSAISTLTAGNHTVEAFFTSADTNFNDSNDALNGGQIVNKRDTLTTISSSLNPSVYGQSVTFTATVGGTGPGAGNPTGGSVQFKIDGTNAGAPVPLTSGSASSGPINSLTAGNHTVEAVFTSADTNFNNSSDLLDGGQTVNKAPLTITASSHTVTFNDPVPTITASYSGFVLGDDPNDLTPQPTCSTTYTVGSLVGTYPTKCENAGSSNYTFTYVGGTVTVVTACSAFNGFLSPIGGAVEKGNGGSFTDPVRAFKLNSTIPVKFNAICFGAPLTTGVHTIQIIKYSNATDSDPPIDATPTDAATTGNQFRLTGTEWHFNLNTKAIGNGGHGTWLIKTTLFDGSSYTVWVSLKK